jgi:uracil-DNA glycosylase
MEKAREIRLEPSWKARLESEFEQPYMVALRQFLLERKQAGAVIYPPGPLIFNALDSTPFDAVKIAILGQDPYHGPGQAHGLCFSVQEGVALPPSLLNIFREIQEDLGCAPPVSGNLQAWAQQGVLLLNAVLTVERGRAGAHQGKGWERFTDRIVQELNESREGLVFMLWGSYAMKKGAHIDRSRHLVLTAPHPSPLSAHRGFFRLPALFQGQRLARAARAEADPLGLKVGRADKGTDPAGNALSPGGSSGPRRSASSRRACRKRHGPAAYGRSARRCRRARHAFHRPNVRIRTACCCHICCRSRAVRLATIRTIAGGGHPAVSLKWSLAKPAQVT